MAELDFELRFYKFHLFYSKKTTTTITTTAPNFFLEAGSQVAKTFSTHYVVRDDLEFAGNPPPLPEC